MLCTQDPLCSQPGELKEQRFSPEGTCFGQCRVGRDDGDRGGRGEEKPDSGFILKVESMALKELEYVSMRDDTEESKRL